ncbi:MAG TPA: protein-L-isoaspartate(D-aspartate) O-methyltransferase, partial [Gemmataceae bacterium]|nr:protein-L-isoaspartate(D-aspartate) O-methyltransferase [Gemmataceae bacterium]
MLRNNAPRFLPLWLAGAVLLAATACSAKDPDWAKLRSQMVDQQINARGIKDERVLQAMDKVPRHEFVPKEQRANAYRDDPLPIGEGQTISQPYIVALMTAEAKPGPEHRVLEIGTGSGYQAAVLSELVKEVYTIELVPTLADQARDRLKRLGYGNVQTRTGDGYKGWPEAAPFDAVVVT